MSENEVTRELALLSIESSSIDFDALTDAIYYTGADEMQENAICDALATLLKEALVKWRERREANQ